jgi:4-hydroxybenzoate polyprenyltransferase
MLGLLSMPLVVCYPLMKRLTNWPQLVLGLTFNWGALVGWTAAVGPQASLLSEVTSLTSLPALLAGGVGGEGFADRLLALQLPAGFLEQALPLYCAGVCWTLVYDTLYGYQDRQDDQRIGLKSTALTLGDEPQLALSGLSLGVLGGLVAAGSAASLSAPFFLGAAGMWTHCLWQIWTADVCDPANLWRRFSSNQYSEGLLAAAIVAGHYHY